MSLQSPTETSGTPPQAPARDGARSSVPPVEYRAAGGEASTAQALLLAAIGAAAGASAYFDGYFSMTVWGFMALGVLAVLFGSFATAPVLPRGVALAALAGAAGLWLWSLASVTWAESAHRALVEANRWLLYASFLLLILALLRGRPRLGAIALGAIQVAMLAVIALMLVRMLALDGGELFRGGRIYEPLRYTNGMAGFLLLAFWPMIALAEAGRGRLVSALAVGGASVVASLLLLTQSRAIVPAVVLSAAVLLLLLPGRRQRFWAVATALGGMALAAPFLLRVYEESFGGFYSPDGPVRTAALAALAGGALAALAWYRGSRRVERYAKAGEDPGERLARLSRRGVAGVVVAAVVAMLATVGSPFDEIDRQWDAFANLAPSADQTSRFTTGGSNRYDYWRIALEEFRDRPLAGLGAGNYTRQYFAERRTHEFITQPHSIPLQTLAELGLVGGAFLTLLAVSVVLALRRRARVAILPRDRALMVAAGGVFLVWLVHAGVDWVHNFPGLTAVALIGAAILLAPHARRPPPGDRSPRMHRAAIAAMAVVLGLAAVPVARTTLSELARRDGSTALAGGDARRALDRANRAVGLNGESTGNWYLKAGALARFGNYRESRAALLEAAEREPHNPTTHGLLGDLAVRRGDLDRARRHYRRAFELSPRDPTFEALAADPEFNAR